MIAIRGWDKKSKLVNYDEYVSKMKVHRCGWCGTPTDEGGFYLQGSERGEAIERIESGKYEEVLTHGECGYQEQFEEDQRQEGRRRMEEQLWREQNG